jgi:hypothetical protein
MVTWKEALYRAAISGSIAALLSAGVLAARGRREVGSAGAPLNGPTQLLFGEDSARRRDVGSHTALGFALHHLIAIGWATLHEKYVAPLARRSSAGALVGAGASAAIAYTVDYGIAKGRFQPGFEKHLSRGSLLLVYCALAAGFSSLALFNQAKSSVRSSPSRSLLH